jgi:hypothetical protein
MIEGYVFPLSAYAGETLSFHLGDRTAPGERQVVVRFQLCRRPLTNLSPPPIQAHWGVEVRLRNDETCRGVEYERGCNWGVAYSYKIDESLKSGLYFMQVTVMDGKGGLTQEKTCIPFVVKGRISQPAPMLVVFPTSTILAYNNYGGRSLYTDFDSKLWHRVHVMRPGQFGEIPPMGPDYIASSYDAFLSFLEQEGLAADYGVSYDLHADPDYLDAHRLYVSIGHDEYWSREMRDNVEAFIANGGNAAFLSGNNVWWAVRFYDGKATFPGDESTDVDIRAADRVLPIVQGQGRLMVCYKERKDPIEEDGPDWTADPTQATHNWHRVQGPNRPGSILTGLSSRRGGHRQKRPLPEAFFRAKHPAHWIFEGASLREKQRIGEPPHPLPSQCDPRIPVQLVGYETDAIDSDSPSALVNLAETDNLCSKPFDFERLGEPGVALSNIVLFRRNGTVFSAGTVGWIDGLNPVRENHQCRIAESNIPGSPAVWAITRNVLQRLSAKNPAEIAVLNRGFERWDASAPTGWKLEGSGTAQRKARLDRAQPENARRNASFSAELAARREPVRLVSSACKVEPGRWYRLTAWSKTTALPGQVRIEVTGHTQDGQERPFLEASPHSGMGTWELSSGVGRAPEGLTEARIHVWCDAGKGIEVDDMLLEDLDQLSAVSGDTRLNGQYARGVPIQNADFGLWLSGVPIGWSGSSCSEGETWHGNPSIHLDGRASPARITHRVGPLEWRSYYRLGMWARSDTLAGAVARLYRLDGEHGLRVDLLAEARSRAPGAWAYTWGSGKGLQQPQVPMPEVFWAELELAAAPGAQCDINNVSIDIVGTYDKEDQVE